MSMFHPDEEASKENEFGPPLDDGICTATEMCLPHSFRRRVQINTAVGQLVARQLWDARLEQSVEA